MPRFIAGPDLTENERAILVLAEALDDVMIAKASNRLQALAAVGTLIGLQYPDEIEAAVTTVALYADNVVATRAH